MLWSPLRRDRPAPAPADSRPCSRTRASSLRARPTPSTEWIRSNSVTARRALFACRWPTRCQRRPVPGNPRGPRPWPPPPAPCSRRSRGSRRRTPSRTASAGWVLLTATRVTSSGRRRARAAARAMRSRTAATRSAITSWASAPAEALRPWPRSGRSGGISERYFSRCATASSMLFWFTRDRPQVVVGLRVVGVEALDPLEGRPPPRRSCRALMRRMPGVELDVGVAFVRRPAWDISATAFSFWPAIWYTLASPLVASL